jgi:predicted amidohydrolase
VLELAASWGEPRRALDDVDAALGEGPATDLVLLPEASLTGYVSADGDFDLTRFAEPLLGPTGRAIAAVAERRGVVLVAPLVLREAGACFNAMVAFDRHGEHLFTYRKRHPWFPERWATPGAAPAPRVVIDGVGVTIAVCYDVHFLAEASDALDASDLLLFPSAWVEDEDSRPARLRALARRHHVAIANANWGAGVVRIPGQGSSSILGADGATLARAAPAPRGRRVARADAVVVVAPPPGSPPVSR